MVTVKTFFIVKLQINLRFPVAKLENFWMNVFLCFDRFLPAPLLNLFFPFLINSR